MEISDKQQIGTHFKKEKVFLGTITSVNDKLQEKLKDSGDIATVIESFCKMGFLSMGEPDILYKDESGYTRFEEEGTETLVGDNSDGKGFVRNLVSIWKYFSEEQIFEIKLNNGSWAICCSTPDPVYKYDNYYNKM